MVSDGFDLCVWFLGCLVLLWSWRSVVLSRIVLIVNLNKCSDLRFLLCRLPTCVDAVFGGVRFAAVVHSPLLWSCDIGVADGDGTIIEAVSLGP